MNGRRAVVKPLLAAACVIIFMAAVAVAVAAPSSRDVLRPPAAALSPGRPPAADASAPAAKYVPGQVIVKYKASVTAAHARADAAREDAAVKSQIVGPAVPNGRLAVVHSATLTTAQLIAKYKDDPQVSYVEPDYIEHAYGTPNDPLFNELWGMQQIYAPQAWNVSTGSSSVVVADLDSGIDYTHPDLVANLWTNPGEIAGDGKDNDNDGYIDDVHGINFSGNGRDYGDPWDDNGHGTATAGTMAAVGDNGIGVAGVCPTVKIMACKFVDSSGAAFDSRAIKCINYIILQKQRGVNVVAANNSWGSTSSDQLLSNAISSAGGQGIVFVCAAGNDGADNDTTPHYPASDTCANIISVAASDDHDGLAWFSDYGATSVDLAAPGKDVLSSVPSAVDPSLYQSKDGTSMAAPHVTGAIGLCAAVFPNDTLSQRMHRVLDTVDTSNALAGMCSTGGRLDVSRAVGGAAPSDDDIPGVTMPLTHVSLALDAASDANDVFHVYLKAGSVLNARLAPLIGEPDFDLYLFGPDATTVGDKSAALASATGGSYPLSLSYTVPSTGTYYLDAYASSGSAGYELVCSTGSDEIPGVAMPPSPMTLYMEEVSDVVGSLQLQYGQTLAASLTGPADVTSFMPYLFGSPAFSVWTDPKLASGSTGAYPHDLTYTAWKSGTYYLDASAHPGFGRGTLTWSVTGPGDNDISGAPPIPGTWYQGLISSTYDQDDVFTIPVFSRQTVNVSVTGDSGTEYDLYAFDPSATTVEGHSGALASATGTTYPQSLTFTGAASSSFFATNYYVDVHAVTGEGGYTITYSTLYDTTAPTTTAAGLRTSATAWQNTWQLVTLGATDTGGSGLAETDYTIDGVQHTYAGPLIISASGSHVITYWSTDAAGNQEPAHTGYVNIDTTAPLTRPSGLQASTSTGWRNTSQPVTLVPHDTQSGVAATYYRIGLEETDHPYTGQFTVSAAGSTIVDYWSTDVVGNIETVRHGYVNIDRTAPTVAPATLTPAPTAAGWNDGDVAVTINASDSGGAGVQKTQYAVHNSGVWSDADAGNQFTVPGPADHSGDGVHVYDLRALDNAGNVSATGTVSVAVDTIAPQLHLTSLANGQWVRIWDRVSAAPSDEASGIDPASLLYRVDGGPWLSGASVKLKTVRHGKHNNGVHTVDYQVADEAGNSASGSVLVKIDSMAPRTTDDAPTTTVTTPITVTLTPLDAGCGVLCTWWTLGDGVWQSGTSVPLTPPSSGTLTQTITYYSVDDLGNTERFRSASVTLAAP